MGKSQLVFQIADHIARVQRCAVTITCAHDGAAKVAQRLIAVRANVSPSSLFRRCRFDPRDAQSENDTQRRVQSALVQAHTIPILLDDTRRLTVGEIANRASRFAAERSVPLGAIILDGIDALVSGRGRSPRDDVT
jgi:replicative DNA helicase